ncbi:hypothetical protein [Roseateles violae]|uniref:Uncharacterized protein n=1 Tax=Roseateles violae TaxID=3058042 RepID=A0ABT8DT74_9BURK|nr:hypothetical protein [Pelomonas sp. PFR6]MDN3921308.1 hypothetical protein [Pelomonas sp. PFR6]
MKTAPTLMKSWLALALAATLGLPALAQTTPTAAPAASAPRAAKPPKDVASKPGPGEVAPTPAEIAASKNWGATNPAFKAVETSRAPGLERPRQQVVPQVNVPFRGKGDTSTPGAIVPGGVDDSAARCLASTSPEQRRACEQAAREAEAKRNGNR